ncbi:MAG: hypothetical protein RI575_08205 [Balneolaceae bacterium]|nr:hypothetical protein [Balneolaceae bacterium]MDR9410137.1 hypothetical protein [Balneolaceae bacterium]
MKHKFYQKSDSEQRRVLWIFGILLFLICSLILVVAFLSGFYVLGFLIPIAFLVAAPFLDLPMGRKSGKFIYYSPLFITEPERDHKIIVHGGTLFDYLYTITPDLNGRERTKFVLYGYLLGLINLITEYEVQDEENLRIRGTSYIINEKTAKRFGLQPVQTDFLQYLILLFNYIPITISNSFIKRKPHFPKFSDIKTYEGKLSEIARHKEKLIELKNKLEP